MEFKKIYLKNKYNLALRISIIFAIFFWIITLNQPLIDKHSFRQTQTALTVLFNPNLITNFLNYKTPVLGFPWQIPFEFPLFQIFVSSISKVLPINISILGRLTSIILGISCLIPIRKILNIFNINSLGIKAFFILYFSSSIYLYWNRAFLIESTALFFSLWSVYLYLKILNKIRNCGLSKGLIIQTFLLFATLTLSMLVKITTAFPILIIFFIDILRIFFYNIYFSKQYKYISAISIFCIICLASSLIYYFWNDYTNSIKLENYFSSFLLGSNIKNFVFGNIFQRFSISLWGKVVIFRCFYILGVIPILFLTYKIFPITNLKLKVFLIYNFFLFLFPLIFFTNLHNVHEYYQYANEIYLIIFLSTIFSESQILNNGRYKVLGHNTISIFVISSYIFFIIYYLPSASN